MIAAAMGTREIFRPKYVDLARAEADIERTLDLDQCARLAQVAINGEPINARLQFAFAKLDRVGWTDAEHIRVSGEVDWRCTLACQRCPESVEQHLVCRFSAWLVDTEDEAATVSIADDDEQVIVLSGSELDLVELLEDELLLSIPAQVCTDAACVHRPRTSFGSATSDVAEDDQQSPFAILRHLSDADGEDKQ